jgi:hypothetical protein
MQCHWLSLWALVMGLCQALGFKVPGLILGSNPPLGLDSLSSPKQEVSSWSWGSNDAFLNVSFLVITLNPGTVASHLTSIVL